jgi:DNA-binding FadR family transcriptional regulator
MNVIGQVRSVKDGKKVLRVHHIIARDIGINIVSGKLKPGSFFDDEIAESSALRVSRTTYREAMKILAAKGLIEARPRVGTQISACRKWHLMDPDVVAWIFMGEPSEQLLDGLFELRGIIEPEAAALAASRRTDAQARAMADAFDDMAKHGLGCEPGKAADRLFHTILLEAADNAFLASLTDGMTAAVTWTTEFKQRNSPLQRDPIPDHREVLDAVVGKDPERARQAMVNLVNWALIDTRRSLGPLGGRPGS